MIAKKTNLPLVSVVMCVYNGERFLSDAVQSILDQTYRDLEFIIVNDGSTDGTAQILDVFQAGDTRVQVLHRAHEGIYPAVNTGCRQARGDYIARFDADDISFPERLERQIAYLEQHSEIAVLGTAAVRIDEHGRVFDAFYPPTESSRVAKVLPHWDPILQYTVTMRKQAFEAAGGYRDFFEVAGDYDLWLRMAEKHRLANLPHPLVYARVHAGEVSYRRVRRQALLKLVAQSDARARRRNKPTLTPPGGVLSERSISEMGVTRQDIDKSFFEEGYIRAQAMLRAGDAAHAHRLLEEISSLSGSEGFRKKLAVRVGRMYIETLSKNCQFVHNLLIFLWAGCCRLDFILVLLRLKLRFLRLNSCTPRTAPELAGCDSNALAPSFSPTAQARR